MSAPDRRAMVERAGNELSVRHQCALLSLTRSAVYRSKPVAGADDLAVMRRICSATIWMGKQRQSGWQFWRSRRGDDCRGATITQALFCREMI